MWIDRLVDSRTTRSLSLAAQYAEQRHGMLAENLANIDTPDYAAKVLDPRAFQRALGAALVRARESHVDALELRGEAQVATRGGALEVRPATVPPPHILFHDGTNARIEDLMVDLQENATMYEFATSVLRGQYQSLLNAIRGRVS